MSKYIKTRDNIFEVVTERELVYIVKSRKNPETLYTKSKCQTEVLLEGDKVRQLCDEFIEICPNHRHVIFSTYRQLLLSVNRYYVTTNLSMKEKFMERIKEGYIFYGAIWTSNGLKYVSIADEKGDFQLL